MLFLNDDVIYYGEREKKAQKPSNMTELKQFSTEDWARFPPQPWERLIVTYHKHLIAVIAAGGGTASY